MGRLVACVPSLYIPPWYKDGLLVDMYFVFRFTLWTDLRDGLTLRFPKLRFEFPYGMAVSRQGQSSCDRTVRSAPRSTLKDMSQCTCRKGHS